MHILRFFKLPACAGLCAFLSAGNHLTPQQPSNETARFPYAESLTYRVAWRLVTAGNANIRMTRVSGENWQTDLQVKSVGLVDRLFHVQDSYKLITSDRFCGISLNFDAQEGKHHVLTTLNFDKEKRKVSSVTKEFSGATHTAEFNTPACAYDIMGALMSLRTLPLETGMKTALAVTDGKKLATVKIEAQAKETIAVDGKNYNTLRFEAFVFDGVLYRRKGRLFMWLTDDAQHLPVQMRFQLSFPIGDITLALEKVEKP